MKRVITFLCAVVLLLSFSACGNNSNSETSSISTHNDIDNSSETKQLNDYLGEWKANVIKSRFQNETTYQVSTIVLKEDGSCTYNGENAEWKLVEEENRIIFTLLSNNVGGTLDILSENGKVVLQYSYAKYYRPSDFVEKDEVYIEEFPYSDNPQIKTNDIKDNSNDGTKTQSGVNSTQANSTKVIITLDNWNEYFKVTEYPHWEQNAFNEIDDLGIWWGISLKDEYQNRIDMKKQQSVAFQLSAKYKEYVINIDYKNKQYSYADSLYEYEADNDNQTITYDLLSQFNNETNKIEFLRVFSSGIGKAEKDGKDVNAIYKYYDISVPRVEGYIYLLAN